MGRNPSFVGTDSLTEAKEICKILGLKCRNPSFVGTDSLTLIFRMIFNILIYVAILLLLELILSQEEEGQEEEEEKLSQSFFCWN